MKWSGETSSDLNSSAPASEFELPRNHWAIFGWAFLSIFWIFQGSRHFLWGEQFLNDPFYMSFTALACGIGFFVLVLSELKKHRYVSLGDGKLWVQTVRGSKFSPKSLVTFVDDDLIQFHLYDNKERYSISKRRLPANWVVELELHRDAGAKASSRSGVSPTAR